MSRRKFDLANLLSGARREIAPTGEFPPRVINHPEVHFQMCGNIRALPHVYLDRLARALPQAWQTGLATARKPRHPGQTPMSKRERSRALPRGESTTPR